MGNHTPRAVPVRGYPSQWKDLSLSVSTGGLILVEVSERVLRTVVVCVIVSIDRLRFQPRDRVELFDRRRAQARESTENSALNFSDFRVLHRINEGVLRLRGMILELLRGVLFSERCDLVE